jgi:hypothetical protein
MLGSSKFKYEKIGEFERSREKLEMLRDFYEKRLWTDTEDIRLGLYRRWSSDAVYLDNTSCFRAFNARDCTIPLSVTRP